MRPFALALALLAGGCTLALTRTTRLHIGGEAQVRHTATARQPKLFFGLRLSLIHGDR